MADDVFLAMLQGLNPDKAENYAARLRGQDQFGKVFSSSLDPNAQRLGQADSADAMSKTKFLGLARAKKAAQEEADRIQQGRWDTTDQQLEEQRAQSQANWEEQMEFDRLKLEEGNALKLAIQKMKGQQRASTVDKEVNQMADRLTKGNVPQLEAAFKDMNEVLAPYLNEDGTVKEGTNIPGAGGTNWLPSGVLTTEGKRVKQVLAGVRNQVLKMMSGAAVTDPEMARVYEQIGEYLGGDDSDIVFGMGMLQRIADDNRANIEAGFSDEALTEYDRRLQGRKTDRASIPGDVDSYFDEDD